MPVSSPVRVLLDATALPPGDSRGGVSRYVDELVSHWPSNDVPLTVVAKDHDIERYAAALGPAAVVTGPSWLGRQAARLAWEQSGLPLLAARRGVDVIFSPHYTMPVAGKVLRHDGHRVAQVVTLHDATFFSHPHLHSGIKARFFPAWTRASVRLADALIAPSQATVDEVRGVTGAAADRFTVIPHGVDHARFHPPSEAEVAAARAWAGLAPGQPFIAFLGTIEPRKNVPALIRAFTEVCRDRVDPPALVLAGGRGWDDEVDPAIAAVPTGLVVRRPGFVPEELAAGLLGGALVVAYPSLGEGFGLPVLEGMACGTAVLTTRLLSLPEVGGDTVAYAASPDSADVATTLRRLLDDPAERGRLAAAGLARAQTFTWERTVREHVDLLRRVGEPQGEAVARHTASQPTGGAP